HHDGLPALDDGEQMFSPKVQRLAFLLIVGRSIIDARNTALMTRGMVQHRLDHMRLNSQLGHARGDGAPQIVRRPTRRAFSYSRRYARVDLRLGLTQSLKACIVAAKYVLAIPAVELRQYHPRRRTERANERAV